MPSLCALVEPNTRFSVLFRGLYWVTTAILYSPNRPEKRALVTSGSGNTAQEPLSALLPAGKGSENRRFSEIVLFQNARAQVVLKRDARVFLRIEWQVVEVWLL